MTEWLVWFGGAVCAGGLWWTLYQAGTQRASLAETVAALHALPGPTLRQRRSDRVIAELGRRLPWSGLDHDLAVVGRTREQHLGVRITAAGIGAVSPPVLLAVARAAGSKVPMLTGLALGVAGIAAGWLVADSVLRERAAQARRDWRRGLSSMVELIRALVAAGIDIRAAAIMATRAGTSPLFVELRRRVDIAAARHDPLPPVFAGIGELVAVRELVDLGALMELVTSGGIDPRQALEAKADSLRTSELAELRTEVATASEHMNFPLAVMGLVFAVLVGYPSMMVVLRAI